MIFSAGGRRVELVATIAIAMSLFSSSLSSLICPSRDDDGVRVLLQEPAARVLRLLVRRDRPDAQVRVALRAVHARGGDALLLQRGGGLVGRCGLREGRKLHDVP